jgi:hypothetical protein
MARALGRAFVGEDAAVRAGHREEDAIASASAGIAPTWADTVAVSEVPPERARRADRDAVAIVTDRDADLTLGCRLLLRVRGNRGNLAFRSYCRRFLSPRCLARAEREEEDEDKDASRGEPPEATGTDAIGHHEPP